MSNLGVHFSSVKPDWETPHEVVMEWAKRYGKHGSFELDVCATRMNRKAMNYLGPDHPFKHLRDGLAVDWQNFRCWMNPPYGREIGLWVSKAAWSAQNGAVVVCLLPARTDSRWWQDNIGDGETWKPWIRLVKFRRGRIRFEGAKASAPFPSVVVVMAQRMEGMGK